MISAACRLPRSYYRLHRQRAELVAAHVAELGLVGSVPCYGGACVLTMLLFSRVLTAIVSLGMMRAVLIGLGRIAVRHAGAMIAIVHDVLGVRVLVARSRMHRSQPPATAPWSRTAAIAAAC